jgi:hypothetical protein
MQQSLNIRRLLAPSCVLLVLSLCGGQARAQATVAAQPATQNPDPQRWPMNIQTPQGLITVYQPQLTRFDGDTLWARAAVSVTPPGQTEPLFGAIWMQSRVSTDRVARTVRILDVTVTRARFPESTGETEQALTAAMRSTLPQEPMTLSLDQLTAMLEIIQQKKAVATDLSTDPPRIIFRDHPAILVQYDGAPRLAQAPNSSIFRAVNTPFFVTLEPATKTYYLKGAGQWFAAPNPLGPFQASAQVPQSIAAAADADGYKDPQQPLSPAQAAAVEIVTATEPTELIWTDGPEEMGTIPNTDLLYVTNTDSDVFLEIQTQQIFVLLSGRWYTAATRNGPWTYVAPDKLPPDFKLIPPDSDKGSVLANVAGTQAAKDAIADTFVPQTAAIDRNAYEQPPVQYDGDPDFQPVEGTSFSYAANTPSSVLLVAGQYYCCYNAVWYLSPHPAGPWNLCTSVPAVIYTIPPTCPIYSVRYCHVYAVTPQYIYCGYTPGYVGCYPYHGVVVYGTGYHYSPWAGKSYYPRPWTYGFAAQYEPGRNQWGFAVGFAAGGGDLWLSARSNSPAGRQWFGHGGFRPAQIRNAPVNIHPVMRNDQWNLYQRRKDVRRDLSSARPTQRLPERSQPAAAHPLTPPSGERPTRLRNNVLADPQGNVYRKTLDGWEQRRNNKWVPRTTPAKPEPQRAKPVPVPARPNQANQPNRATPNQSGRAVSPQPRRAESKTPQAAPSNSPRRIESAQPGNQRPTPSNSELNQEYRARVAGEQRSRSGRREPAAAPAPVRAPSQSQSQSHSAGPSPGRDGSGNTARQGGNTGNHSPGPRP